MVDNRRKFITKDSHHQAEGLTLGDLHEGAIVKDIEGFTEPWIVLSHDHYGPGNTLLFLKGVDPAGTRVFDSGTANWGGSELKTYIDTTFKNKLSSQFNATIRPVTIADGGTDYPNTDVFLLSYRELGGTNTAFQGGTKIANIEAYRHIGVAYWTRSQAPSGVDRTSIVGNDGNFFNVTKYSSSSVRPAVNLDPSTPVFGPYTIEGETYYTLFGPDPFWEAIDVVNTSIAALPAAEAVKYRDKLAIDDVKAEFDSLSPAQQALVTNAAKLDAVVAVIAMMESKVADVDNAIAALPAKADVKLANKQDVQDARDLYDKLDELDEDLQALVSNVDKLLDAEAAIADLEAGIAAVDAAIAGLPAKDDVKLTDKPAIEAARTLYDALTGEQQDLVDDYSRLTDAETKMSQLEIALVSDAINQLQAPDKITLADKAAVDAARSLYDDLSPAQQAAVDDAKLIAAEAAIQALIANGLAVGAEIDKLPAQQDVTLDDKPAIEAVRALYDALDQDQKDLIGNIDKLTDAEAAIWSLEVALVNDRIDALPASTDVTRAHQSEIEEVKLLYDALTPAQKDLIVNVKKLEEVVKQLNTILRPPSASQPAPPAPIELSERSGEVASIERSEEDGVKVDTVRVTEEGVQIMIERAASDGSGRLDLIIEADEEDPADAYRILLPQKVLSALTESELPLQIETAIGIVHIPAEAVESMNEAGEDVQINIVRMTKESEILNLEQMIKAFDPNFTIIGNFTRIEANISNGQVGNLTATLPLINLNLPADSIEAAIMLDSIAVFGLADEKLELLEGSIQYDADGHPVGITYEIGTYTDYIVVNKFPSFIIKLQMDSMEITVNGDTQLMDVAPIAQHYINESLVPLRFVNEGMGHEVEWIAETRQVRIIYDHNTMVITIDSNKVIVNDQEKFVDTVPEMHGGRTYVRVHFIVDEFGLKVYWDESTGTLAFTK